MMKELGMKGKQLVRVLFIMNVVFIFLMFPGTNRVMAEKLSVTREILEILKENKQISSEQYEGLMKKAKDEGLSTSDFKAYWKDGLIVEGKDAKIKIGGRIHYDFGAVGVDKELEDTRDSKNKAIYDGLEGHGSEVRRARLYAEGTLYDSVVFKSEFEFGNGNGDVAMKDVWFGLKGVPYIEKILVGHMKEPFSLEEMTSDNYHTFMERSLMNVFAPSYNAGFRANSSFLDKRMTWAVGGFQDVNDFADAFNDFSDINLTGRITGLPWYGGENKLLHLGFNYSHQFRSGEENPLRYRSRPEAHLTDIRLVDTGSAGIPVNDVDLIGGETAIVLGPFSFQGEYIHSFLNLNADDADLIDDPDFYGFYVSAGYFITGESRPYNKGEGIFGRVKPLVNFHPTKGGCGAWEVALRYSYLNLNSGDIHGGREKDLTAGVNWYLNPNTRVMFNYVRAMLDRNVDSAKSDIDGSANIFEGRFQVDF
ncbi:MAG: OprO/OprP family phosphate-selective porin [Syntrophobacteraceae bacterium]